MAETTEEKNMQLMQTLDDAWNSQDWDTFSQRHSEDCAVFWPGQPDPTKGVHNHRAESTEFFKSFPDNHVGNRPYKIFFASGLTKRVGDVAEPDFICLPEDMLVGEAVKVMRDRDVSSILVSRRDSHSMQSMKHYVGILTERDILYRVMAENRGPYKVTLGRIMSSPLVTVNANASVRDAIVLMESKQIRRLPVVNHDEEVIGLVTLKTVIGNMPSHNINLAEMESSRFVADRESVCPYCRSVISDGHLSMAEHMSGTHMQKQS